MCPFPSAIQSIFEWNSQSINIKSMQFWWPYYSPKWFTTKLLILCCRCSFILKHCYWSSNKPKHLSAILQKLENLHKSQKDTRNIDIWERCRKSTLEKYSFFIDNDPIEISQDCSYLGLSFCANGNFSNSKRIPIEKCRRYIWITESW